MKPTDFQELHDSTHRRWFDGARLGRVLVQAFPAYRADQALHIRILPGRARRCENLLDFESMHGSVEVISVDAIAVSDHVARGCVPGEGFDELPSCPFRAGMLRHIKVEDSPSIMRQHQKHEEDAESDCGHGEEVDGDEVLDVIVEECPPRQARWLAGADHVLADRGL